MDKGPILIQLLTLEAPEPLPNIKVKIKIGGQSTVAKKAKNFNTLYGIKAKNIIPTIPITPLTTVFLTKNNVSSAAPL